ncbi:MAG TPA: hypothetical protein VGY77_10775, partial [Gemmataceae bacterium]|nr:hypothetical protein [Gemmataceae bacterium]
MQSHADHRVCYTRQRDVDIQRTSEEIERQTHEAVETDRDAAGAQPCRLLDLLAPALDRHRTSACGSGDWPVLTNRPAVKVLYGVLTNEVEAPLKWIRQRTISPQHNRDLSGKIVPVQTT